MMCIAQPTQMNVDLVLPVMKQALSLETLALPVTLDTRSAYTPTISGTLRSADRIWEITKSTLVCYT